MGEGNPKLNAALKQLSAAKYGRPRALVEKAIFDRLGAADREKQDRLRAMRAGAGPMSNTPKPSSSGSSFLDEWLAKRQQLGGGVKSPALRPSSPLASSKTMSTPPPKHEENQSVTPQATPLSNKSQNTQPPDDKLHLRGNNASHHDSEVSIKLH